MSTARCTPLIFLLLTTCRVDPKREPTASVPPLKLSHDVDQAPEIFPRVLDEPQPVADALLVQSPLQRCLADAPGLASPDFSVELSGRVTRAGRVRGTRALGVGPVTARCLEVAMGELLLRPNAPGPFRVTLTRRPTGAGAGVIIAPSGSKKFE